MKLWKPMLDFWLDIYVLQIRTALYRDNCNMDFREYLWLEVTLLRKWGFKFRLYDTGVRIMQRGK